MIIDVHSHVFAWPKIRNFPDSPAPFLSVGQQLGIMTAKGIDKAVILSIGNPECPCETQSAGEILYICEKNPGKFIPFFNIDPRRKYVRRSAEEGDFLDLFEQHKALGFKGIGELTCRLFWDDPLMIPYLSACEKAGLPILFHMSTPTNFDYGMTDDIGLPRLEKVLGRFPGLIFIGHSGAFWAHIAKETNLLGKQNYDDYGKGMVGEPGRIPELMRKYSNLYADISAGSGNKALTRDETYAYEFLNEFQDKLLFGQDYCTLDFDMPHLEWLKKSLDNKKISKEVFDKITGLNTAHLLKLK